MINMGIADYIKTRLLNNRVEQYNTKRSYWGEDERQPRTDGINTGLDLPDALPPVINKTIANALYIVDNMIFHFSFFSSVILSLNTSFKKFSHSEPSVISFTVSFRSSVACFPFSVML